MTEITSLDEISVRNQVVVVVNGEDKYFPISQLNLDFENSTDDEVFDAVNRVLSEGGEQVPKDGYVIQRSANNGNILAFPKTELGS